MKIEVKENENLRIDKYLSLETDISRSKIQKLIKNEKVLVNGEVVTNNYKVNLEDKIEILNLEEEFNIDIKPSNIPIDVVYEDDDL